MDSLPEIVRNGNAVMSGLFIPVVAWIFYKSIHHSSILYRLGMLCIIAGLVNNIILRLGWFPMNMETWVLKDVGIYLAVIGIAINDWKERTA